jgi:hypothetical protein
MESSSGSQFFLAIHKLQTCYAILSRLLLTTSLIRTNVLLKRSIQRSETAVTRRREVLSSNHHVDTGSDFLLPSLARGYLHWATTTSSQSPFTCHPDTRRWIVQLLTASRNGPQTPPLMLITLSLRFSLNTLHHYSRTDTYVDS